MRKRKPKPDGRRKYAPGQSPTEVARAAGCSRPLAHRLLARGMTVAAIVERCRVRREQEAARTAGGLAARRNGGSNGVGNGGNGNGGNGTNGIAPLLSYSAAQAAKENWLYRLRQQEYEQKAGELVPIAEVRQWQAHLWIPLLQSLRHLPSELRDSFDLLSGPELEALLRDRIDAITSAVVSYIDECASRSGKPAADGALRCGAYVVKWCIELAPPEVSPAADVPNGSAPDTEAMQ